MQCGRVSSAVSKPIPDASTGINAPRTFNLRGTSGRENQITHLRIGAARNIAANNACVNAGPDPMEESRVTVIGAVPADAMDYQSDEIRTRYHSSERVALILRKNASKETLVTVTTLFGTKIKGWPQPSRY